MSNQFKAFDYGAFIDVLINGIKSDLNIDLISANDTGSPPAMPYMTYQFLSPHLEIGQSVIGDRSPAFDIVVTFTAHDKNVFKAFESAGQLSNWLTDREVIYQLRQKDIAVINVYDYEQRDSLLSIEYDRQVGFEARFRVPQQLNNIEKIISSVGIKDSNGNDFSVSKND